MEAAMERQMWQLLEPVHAIVYYAPEVFEEFAKLGYDTDTRWPTYFALRPAPLGAPTKELVTATFYSFSPKMVAEHVPTHANQEEILKARLTGVDRALRRILG